MVLLYKIVLAYLDGELHIILKHRNVHICEYSILSIIEQKYENLENSIFLYLEN